MPAKQAAAAAKDGLTAKQRAFVEEYLANGFNATQAAIAAGYSAGSADTQGSRLLVNVKVAADLGKRAKKASAKREISAERILDELAKMAFFDPRKLFSAEGALVDIHLLGDDEAAAIAGLEVRELKAPEGCTFRLKKIKIADKRGSLELLGKHLKLFTDKVEHTGTVGVQLLTSVPRPKRDEPK